MTNLANELNKHTEKMNGQELRALRKVLRRRLPRFIDSSVKAARKEAAKKEVKNGG